jgi:hypothetical protein
MTPGWDNATIYNRLLSLRDKLEWHLEDATATGVRTDCRRIRSRCRHSVGSALLSLIEPNDTVPDRFLYLSRDNLPRLGLTVSERERIFWTGFGKENHPNYDPALRAFMLEALGLPTPAGEQSVSVPTEGRNP